MRISKITIFIAILIVLSASFLRQVMNFVKATVGQGGFVFLIGITGAFFLISFLILMAKRKSGFVKGSIFLLTLVIGIWLAWQLKIPEERVHVLEFAVLGWFVSRDLITTNKKAKGIILALLFTIAIGVLDEVFQGVLPYRYFQWCDIGFNSAGGLWGTILYLLS